MWILPSTGMLITKFDDDDNGDDDDDDDDDNLHFHCVSDKNRLRKD